MFDFAGNGGNLYSYDTGTVGGTINIPLPGGGSIDFGGNWGGGNTPTTGGNMPPVYIPPVGTGTMPRQGGGLFDNPMMLLIIVVVLILLMKK